MGGRSSRVLLSLSIVRLFQFNADSSSLVDYRSVDFRADSHERREHILPEVRPQELYQDFAALPVDGTPSASLLAELRQVVQVFAEMKAGNTSPDAEPVPPAAQEKGPMTAPAPQPTEPASSTVPEVRAALAPVSEAAEETVPEDTAAEKTVPVKTIPEKTVPEQTAPEKTAQEETASEETAAAAEAEIDRAGPAEPAGEDAKAPAPGKSESRFDLDDVIARLVRPGRGAADASADRPDPGVVRAVQQQLARLGFDPGPADGRLGGRTAQAIEDYQSARGLPAEGRPTRGLLVRLEREHPGQAAPAAGAIDQPPPAAPGAPADDAAESGAARPGFELLASGMAVRDGYDAFKKGYAAVQVGTFDMAIEFYTRAIEGGDLSLEHLADALYNRGNAYSYKGAHAYAIADYDAAILNKPDFSSAHYNRGFAFEASGRHTRALADFMKARALGLRRRGQPSPDIPPPGP